MKKVIAILIGCMVLTATQAMATSAYRHQTALCASVSNTQPAGWVLSRLGNEFFDQHSIRPVTTYPVAVQSVFTKGKDQRVYLVSRWHDFDPKRTYRFSCEWIAPDGKPYRASSASVKTPESLDPGIYFTYTAYLDLHTEIAPGQWTVHLMLNGDIVETQNLMIASQ